MYGRSIGTQKGPVIDMWPKMEFRLSNCSIQETCHPLPTSLKNPRSARLPVWSKVYSDKPSRCFCKLWLSIAARFGSSLYKQNFTLMIHYYNSIKVEARRLKIITTNCVFCITLKWLNLGSTWSQIPLAETGTPLLCQTNREISLFLMISLSLLVVNKLFSKFIYT